MSLKHGDKLSGYIILEVYDPIYIDEYSVRHYKLGEPTLPRSRVTGRIFIVFSKGKERYRSGVCTGARWKEYIHETVYELQKRELNEILGL